MNIDKLVKALEDEGNVNVIDTNKSSIKNNINNILQTLYLDASDLKLFNKKLKDYIYISNINEIKIGHTIKYINIENPEKFKLSCNYIICNINANDNGINITLKTFNNIFFRIYYHKHLIFKKLSSDELLILKALNYINK